MASCLFHGTLVLKTGAGHPDVDSLEKSALQRRQRIVSGHLKVKSKKVNDLGEKKTLKPLLVSEISFGKASIVLFLALFAILFAYHPSAIGDEIQASKMITRLRTTWQGELSAVVSAEFDMKLYRYPVGDRVITRKNLEEIISPLNGKDFDFAHEIEIIKHKLPAQGKSGEWPIWKLDINVAQEGKRFRTVWTPTEKNAKALGMTRVFNDKEDVLYKPSASQATIYNGQYNLETTTMELLLSSPLSQIGDSKGKLLSKTGEQLKILFGNRDVTTNESNGFVTRIAALSPDGLVSTEILRLKPKTYSDAITLPEIIVDVLYTEKENVQLLSVFHVTNVSINPELSSESFKLGAPKDTIVYDKRADPTKGSVVVCQKSVNDVIALANDYRDKTGEYTRPSASYRILGLIFGLLLLGLGIFVWRRKKAVSNGL